MRLYLRSKTSVKANWDLITSQVLLQVLELQHSSAAARTGEINLANTTAIVRMEGHRPASGAAPLIVVKAVPGTWTITATWAAFALPPALVELKIVNQFSHGSLKKPQKICTWIEFLYL
jgi:hypothetical protein